LSQARFHPRKHIGVLSVEPLVMALVMAPGLGHGLQGLGGVIGQAPGVGQAAAQQVLGALAHGVGDEVAVHARHLDGVAAHVGEGRVHHGDKVTQGVDQGAVEVDDGGGEGQGSHGERSGSRQGGDNAPDCEPVPPAREQGAPGRACGTRRRMASGPTLI